MGLLLVRPVRRVLGVYVWAMERLMTTSQAVGLVVAVGLFVYFIAAMVRPERF